ncbi:hypothetical protein [Mahella sp.]|uniref:hypothetical protein n=1 Tax=Mahella sp. TaxID=2798721 RepID=UPI0025BA10D3|nr:hypothetical protein [Mahella sp.]
MIIYILNRDIYIPLGIAIGTALAIWRFGAFLSLISGYIKPTSTANIISKAMVYPLWNILLLIVATGIIYLLKPAATFGFIIGLGVYGIVMPVTVIMHMRREVTKPDGHRDNG